MPADEPDLLKEVLAEVRNLSANVGILMGTVKSQGEDIGSMHTQMGEIHKRLIDYANTTGERILKLEKRRVARDGNGSHR